MNIFCMVGGGTWNFESQQMVGDSQNDLLNIHTLIPRFCKYTQKYTENIQEYIIKVMDLKIGDYPRLPWRA